MANYPYKGKIEKEVLGHAKRFQLPGRGCQEFPLENRCRADFCFTMIPHGHLFIEDDDGARGVSNLMKYWIWCEANSCERPVHLIHIVETTRPAAVQGINFLADKMQKQVPGFVYHLIALPNWEGPDENWLSELRKVLASI